MTRLRGLGNRVEKALDSVRSGRQYGSERSGSWAKAKKIGSKAKRLDSEPPDTTIEIPNFDDFEVVHVHANSDRGDTIPSPPPDPESAPWQDER
jgi:hypothetical protein